MKKRRGARSAKPPVRKKEIWKKDIKRRFCIMGGGRGWGEGVLEVTVSIYTKFRPRIPREPFGQGGRNQTSLKDG